MSHANNHDAAAADLRRLRRAELELTLFRHGFKIVPPATLTGSLYVRVTTTHAPDGSGEPLMLDYKRDVANYVDHGFGTAHDVAMHFIHRFAFRTQSWVHPPQQET